MKKKKLKSKDVDRILREAAAEYWASFLNEKDVEFLNSIGVKTDLETLRRRSIEEYMKNSKNK